jgi:predicted metal-dependent hydrolase
MTASKPPPAPFEYELVRRRRKTIAIAVRDDGTIQVAAPMRATRADIRDAVRHHADWAIAQQRAQRERWRRRLERRFDDGGTVPYLGRTLRLEVRADARTTEPRLVGDGLRVTVAPGLEAEARRVAVRTAVGRWLVGRAADHIHERHIAMSALVGDAAASISIKDMRTRWGSCGPKRRMSLNWRLILAPPAVIDYVIAHELTHIRHPDHSARFWAAVADACPDWRTSRDWLRAHGDELEL